MSFFQAVYSELSGLKSQLWDDAQTNHPEIPPTSANPEEKGTEETVSGLRDERLPDLILDQSPSLKSDMPGGKKIRRLEEPKEKESCDPIEVSVASVLEVPKPEISAEDIRVLCKGCFEEGQGEQMAKAYVSLRRIPQIVNRDDCFQIVLDYLLQNVFHEKSKILSFLDYVTAQGDDLLLTLLLEHGITPSKSYLQGLGIIPVKSKGSRAQKVQAKQYKNDLMGVFVPEMAKCKAVFEDWHNNGPLFNAFAQLAQGINRDFETYSAFLRNFKKRLEVVENRMVGLDSAATCKLVENLKREYESVSHLMKVWTNAIRTGALEKFPKSAKEVCGEKRLDYKKHLQLSEGLKTSVSKKFQAHQVKLLDSLKAIEGNIFKLEKTVRKLDEVKTNFQKMIENASCTDESRIAELTENLSSHYRVMAIELQKVAGVVVSDSHPELESAIKVFREQVAQVDSVALEILKTSCSEEQLADANEAWRKGRERSVDELKETSEMLLYRLRLSAQKLTNLFVDEFEANPPENKEISEFKRREKELQRQITLLQRELEKANSRSSSSESSSSEKTSVIMECDSSGDEKEPIPTRMGFQKLRDECEGKLAILEKFIQSDTKLESEFLSMAKIKTIRSELSKLHQCETQIQFEAVLFSLGYQKSTGGKHPKYTLSDEALIEIDGQSTTITLSMHGSNDRKAPRQNIARNALLILNSYVEDVQRFLEKQVVS